MISVMQEFETLRNSATSVAATADRSFLGMGNPQEVAPISDGGCGGASSERRVFSVVDSEENLSDMDDRVSVNGEKFSGYVEEKPKLETDGGEEDMMSLVVENRGSFIESRDWMHGFRVGDMVWGKVKSHPWWPGHIYNEAFASPSVRRVVGGLVLVAFFGDSSYGWFDPAELIPFEPYFPEKSRQTTSRSFVRAVEEAVDEASRRGALAVACRCRNLHNYRPSGVAGYFFVDVVGYEPGGLYSSMQIKDARDNFVSSELLSFMLQLALGPRRNNDNTIEWIQTIAKLLAYRRSVFEEFDETYAQAFGVEPVRPSYDSVGVLDQTGRFAPRVAPLSGQLVVAEALGARRSSTRLASQKSPKINKNKYVLKRRDDLPVPTSSSLPALHPASHPNNHAFLPSWPDSGGLHAPPEHSVSGELHSQGLDSNNVLQKREMLPSAVPSALATDPSSDSKPKAELFLPADCLRKSEPGELKSEGISVEPLVYTVPADSSQEHDGMHVMMKEVLKRPREDLSETSGAKKKIKKKKKDGHSANQHPVSMDAGHHWIVAGGSTEVGFAELVPPEDGIDMELPPGLELSLLQLPLLVDDLSSIALDPFYAVERDAPAIVRHVFLRFRSLVFQKSLILLGASEPAAPYQSSLSRDGRGQKETSSSSYTSKPPSKLGDVTKAVRKRDPSDRQGDLSLKKIKKMNQLKELASKKKAAMRQNNSELQQQQQRPRDSKDCVSTTPAEATRKQELPPSPKIPSPTFLIMKFPPTSILPSISNLKARFARFGPLDPTAIRQYWKSYSCKVLFKYKSDAQSAYDFAKNNDLFGQVNVHYNLRDLEVSPTDQAPDARPSLSYRPYNDAHDYFVHRDITQRPFSSQAGQSQLKSILKKPGGDESASNGAAASGAIVKESPRVKFMLKVDDNRSETAVKDVASSSDGGHAFLLESVDHIRRQAPKTVGFSQLHPPPPPSSFSPQQQPLQFPPRLSETHPHHIPPSSSSSASQQILPLPLLQTSTQDALPPPPPPRQALPQPLGVDFHSIHGLQRPLAQHVLLREKSNADISGPMLSLLLKCNDIVSKVKSSLGYTPYHAL